MGRVREAGGRGESDTEQEAEHRGGGDAEAGGASPPAHHQAQQG